MKINLTPPMCYLLGLYAGSPSRRGFGVFGNEDLQDVFAQYVVKCGIAKKEDIYFDYDRANITHAAYEAFFKKTFIQRLERFKIKNEYSANYLAGLFDSCGFLLPDLPKGKVAYGFYSMGAKDEVLFLRLGFNKAKLSKKILLLLDSDLAFTNHIRPYVIVNKDLLP